jgi:methylamine---corrinoid protein Co-methyltransferase
LPEANEWVLKLLPFYEHILPQEGGNPGLPFDQVYDLESIQPLPLWQGMYDEVKASLQDMGSVF